MALGLNLAASTFLIWFPMFSIPPLLLWRSWSLSAVGNYISGALVLCLTTIGICSGGFGAVAMWYLCLAPLVGMLMVGSRTGMYCLLAVILMMSAVAAATLLKIPFPEANLPFERYVVVIAAGEIGLSATVALLGFMFEDAKNRSFNALHQANMKMRFILDNVNQGFVNVDIDGRICGHASDIIYKWFSVNPIENSYIWDIVSHIDADQAEMMELTWFQFQDVFIPIDITIDQLPDRLKVGGCHFGLSYEIIRDKDESIINIIICISDITALVNGEKAEADRKETQEVIQHVVRDREGFLRFFSEASIIVKSIEKQEGNLYALAHTLKGNASIFGVRSVALVCHRLEDELQHEGAPTQSSLNELRLAWDKLSERTSFLQQNASNVLQVPMSQFVLLRQAIDEGSSYKVLKSIVSKWQYEPLALTFSRIGQQAHRIAQALDKLPLNIEVEDNDLWLEPERWQPVWASIIHVIRNAIDHGLEGPDLRIESGKDAEAKLMLRAQKTENSIIFDIADDGAGIDYNRLVKKAQSKGITLRDGQPLSELLFLEGVSSRDETSEYSGRGVGMGAFKAACETLGGKIVVTTEKSKGTTFRITFPTHLARDGEAPEISKAAS